MAAAVERETGIKRRRQVVGIFLNHDSVLRLNGRVLVEQDDEWAAGRRYFSLDAMALVPPEIGRSDTRHAS